jgi:hypothetical protein
MHMQALIAGDPLLVESMVTAKTTVECGISTQVRVKVEPAAGADPAGEGESDEAEGEEVEEVGTLGLEQAKTLSPAGVDAVAGGGCERLPAPTTPQLEQAERMNQHEYSSSTESPGHSDGCTQVKTEAEDLEQEATAVVPPNTKANLKLEKPAECVPCETDEIELQFEDDPTVTKLELLDDGLDDISLSNGMVVDGDGGSGIDVNPCLLLPLPESTMDLHMNIEALDAGEVHDTEIGEEEALLLAEVAKVGGEEGLERSNSLNCLSVDSGECSSGDKKDQSQSDSGTKVNSKATSGRRKMKVSLSFRSTTYAFSFEVWTSLGAYNGSWRADNLLGKTVGLYVGLDEVVQALMGASALCAGGLDSRTSPTFCPSCRTTWSRESDSFPHFGAHGGSMSDSS